MDHEHVEPVQSLNAGRGSRTRSGIAVAIPVAVLLVVAGFGALGRVAPPAPPVRPDVAVIPEPVSPPPDASGDPATIIDPPVLDADGFPVHTIGLTVLSVDETLRSLAGGEIGTGLVAIAGWLSIPYLHGCADATGAVPAGQWDVLCQRKTYLTGGPEPLFSVEQGGIRALALPERRLEPQAVPGIELASIAESQFQGYEGPLRPRRVVLAGRFGDPRLAECRLVRSSPECAMAFAIERVIWLDGEPQVRRAQRYPGLEDADLSRLVRWPILDSATRRGSVVLSELLIPRNELARVDPVADRAVPTDVAGPVWYIRTLLRSRPYGRPTGEVGWAVIEDATANVLAADPDGRSAAAE